MRFLEEDIRSSIRNLTDLELLDEHAQGDCLRVAGVPSTLLRDFNRWQLELEVEMRRRDHRA